MKKLLIASLLSLGLVAGVQAQESESRYAKPDASRIAERIGVTESQLPAFQAVLQAQHEKRRALHQEFRAQNQALEVETEQELAGVLTHEQLEQLKAIKDQKRGQWRDGKRGEHKRGEHKGGKHGAPKNRKAGNEA